MTPSIDPSSDSRLPAGWNSAKDSVSGRVYYVNSRTNETTWVVPTASESATRNNASSDDHDIATGGSQYIAKVSLRDNDGEEDGTVVTDRKMNDSTMPPPPPRASTATMSTPATRTSPADPTVAKNKQTKSIIAAAPPRNKRRFGLGDWNVLLQTANDLALRRGAPLRHIKWKEIRLHNTKHDGWVVIRGKVFFLSPYLAYHPGGEAILCKCLGKDATALYDKYHRWVNLEALIGKLQIGYLDTSRDDDDSDEEDEAGLSLPEHLALSRR